MKLCRLFRQRSHRLLIYTFFFPSWHLGSTSSSGRSSEGGGEHGGINFGTDVMSGRAVLKAEGLQGGVLL